MKTYKLGEEKYRYICMVHDEMFKDIASMNEMAREMQSKADHAIKLYNIAREMGVNMEEAIIDRNDKIDELKTTIGDLRQKMAALKEKKRRKDDMG